VIILYRPEGQDEQHFDMRRLRTSEAQIIERTTDMKWAAIKAGVRADDPTALRGVAWALLKRERPTLRWSEFDPGIEELTSRFDALEVAGYAAEILAMPEEERGTSVAELRFWAFDPAGVDAALEEAASPKEAPPTETSPSDG
jgi:hypothetical protein